MTKKTRNSAPLPSDPETWKPLRLGSRQIARCFRPALSTEALKCRGIFGWVYKAEGRGQISPLVFSDVTVALLHQGTVSAKFESGAVAHMFRPSGLLVLPPGIPMAFAYEDVDCTVVHLKPELLAPQELGDLSRLKLIPQPDPSDHVLTTLTGCVRSQLEAGLPGGRMALETVGSSIVAHIMTLYAVETEHFSRGGLTPRQLQKVRRMMGTAYEKYVSVNDLAEATGLSYYGFSHAYKEATGEAPYQTLQRLRMEHAKTLLRDTRLTLTQIAAELHFASPSHFSTMFKRMFGITPGMYRRMVIG
jgi:AraC family transcriptional regulator